MNLIDFLITKAPTLTPVLEGIYEKVAAKIKETAAFVESQRFMHYIRPDSAQGCFKIAKPITFNQINKDKCSMTTDGSYLYVFFGVHNPTHRFIWEATRQVGCTKLALERTELQLEKCTSFHRPKKSQPEIGFTARENCTFDKLVMSLGWSD